MCGPAATSKHNPRRPLDSLRPMGSMCTRSSGGVMKCVACGAAMRLMQVQTDTATVCGIERHIFSCSACPQSAQRLMFNRARMSGINAPAVATPTEAPAIKLQAARAAGLSGWMRAIEKLGSRQTALKERKAAERTSARPSAVKTPIKSTPIALRAQPAPARPLASSSPAWTNAIEKLGSRETALQERRAAQQISDRLSAVKTALNSRPIGLKPTPGAAKPLANSSPAWTRRSRSSAADKLSSSEQQRPMWPARSTGCGTLCGGMRQWAHGFRCRLRTSEDPGAAPSPTP